MSLLVVSIGNTHIQAGIFHASRLTRRLKIPTKQGLKGFLGCLSNLRTPKPSFDRICLSSVVPGLTKTFEKSLKRFSHAKVLLLTSDAGHGLKIAYEDPTRLGVDRLAGALGARHLLGYGNLIVVDCGTATTITALDENNVLLGGAIMPGLALWAAALAHGTAQLPKVRPRKPRSAVGRSPEKAIESGLFHGHSGAIKNLVTQIAAEAFGSKKFVVLGTGGNAPLFGPEKLFTQLEPDLILTGLLAFGLAQDHHA